MSSRSSLVGLRVILVTFGDATHQLQVVRRRARFVSLPEPFTSM
jgi:hypothetical protein